MMMTHDMPKTIYAVYDEWGCVWFDDPNEKTTEYIRIDKADKLVEALEVATDQLEKTVLGGRIDTKIVNKILDREALAEYSAEKVSGK